MCMRVCMRMRVSTRIGTRQKDSTYKTATYLMPSLAREVGGVRLLEATPPKHRTRRGPTAARAAASHWALRRATAPP